MLFILKVIILIIGIIIVGVLINFTIDFVKTFYFRKCPYCGKRMTYVGLKETDEDTNWEFHCDHCGAYDKMKIGKIKKGE